MFAKTNISQAKFIPAPGRKIAELISASATEAEGVTCRVVEIYPEQEGGDRQPHIHPDMEEVIFVLEGIGSVWVEDHEEKIVPHDLLVVPKKVPHRVINPGGQLKLLCFFPDENVGIP